MKEYQSKISRAVLLGIFRDLDKYLMGIARKVRIYPIGGTKLTLDDAKTESKDIDIISSRVDFMVISDFVANLELVRKIRIDVFPDAKMSGYSIPFYEAGSIRYPNRFRNIELYSLDNAVFCLTKGLAGRPRDLKELDVFLKKYPVPLSRIKQEFARLKINPESKFGLDSKLEYFIEACYSSA